MEDKTIRSIISKMSLHEKVMISTGKNSWRTREYTQYGIPSLLVSDGTNGIRFQIGSDEAEPGYFEENLESSFDRPEALKKTHAATCYPSGSAMACSWNRDLMKKTGMRLAEECRSLGIGMLLGPGMNIRRHPLTARNFEYYSEDPVLSGETAAALVQGVQSGGVGTSIKHFVCHNSDDRRTRVNVTVDERALREIYLAGFERVVKKANPATIMTCYNKINGVEVNHDNRILREIVRGEWGYEGAFISDWGAVKDVTRATEGGLDLQMPCSLSSAEKLEKDIREGKLSEELLDERVYHILKLVFSYAKEGPEPMEYTREENHELARQAAEECMVLLKNEDHILPLKPESGTKMKIAVVGRLAKEPVYVGSGCAIVKTDMVDNPYDEIESLYANDVDLIYSPGYFPDGTTSEELLEDAEKAAEEADVVLVFAGTRLPFESDMYNRTNMSVQEGHILALERAMEKNNNTAVILFGGDVVEMPWISQVKAVLCAWYGGEGMGRALADILFGKASPNGKLAVTIPEKEKDLPAYLTFHQNPYEMVYGESIYVGYRYFDKICRDPRFPFGFGLSYSEFAYDNMRVISEDAEKVIVSLDIKNTGSMEAKETVQIYIAPLEEKTPRPVRELKEFAKVRLLPGETKTVEFTLTQRDFSYFDVTNNEWVTDTPGYRIEAGASSRDIRQSIQVRRPVTVRARRRLRYDSGFHEIFENRITADMFFEFAVSHGLLPADVDRETVQSTLEGTFWAARSFLDMNAHGMVTMNMLDELIDQMNAALEREEV